MKVTFWFVRHGQTLFNTDGRVQGVTDSPLTEKGIRQAESAGHSLRNVWFHQAYVSPSERCIDTSDLILRGRRMQAKVKDALHEQDFGILEARGDEKTNRTFQEHMYDGDFTCVKGESRKMVTQRLSILLNEIVSSSVDGDHVLLVSHGAVMINLLGLLGLDLDAYMETCHKEGRDPIPNAGIFTFTYQDGEYQILQLPAAGDSYQPLFENKTVHFHYVRHGETVFNATDRFQGWSDSPLTEKGVAQAEEVREYVKDVPYAFACCSTALRTRKTASIILEGRKVSLLPLKGLKEIHIGTYEAYDYTPNKALLEPRSRNVHWKDVGGEDLFDLAQRMKDVFALMNSRAKDGDTVLVVSHGGYYMNMLEVLFGIDRLSYRDACAAQGKSCMPNCGLLKFDVVNGTYVFTDYMKSISAWKDSLSITRG